MKLPNDWPQAAWSQMLHCIILCVVASVSCYLLYKTSRQYNTHKTTAKSIKISATVILILSVATSVYLALVHLALYMMIKRLLFPYHVLLLLYKIAHTIALICQCGYLIFMGLFLQIKLHMTFNNNFFGINKLFISVCFVLFSISMILLTISYIIAIVLQLNQYEYLFDFFVIEAG
eukprot:235665_1